MDVGQMILYQKFKSCAGHAILLFLIDFWFLLCLDRSLVFYVYFSYSYSSVAKWNCFSSRNTTRWCWCTLKFGFPSAWRSERRWSHLLVVSSTGFWYFQKNSLSLWLKFFLGDFNFSYMQSLLKHILWSQIDGGLM